MSAKRKPDAKPKSTSAARTRAYRERMRARGLKPVTIWTLNTSNPEIMRQIEESCRRINASADSKAVLDENEAFAADFEPWN